MKKNADWYVEKKLIPPKSFFNWCESQIPIYKWSNKNEVIVSSDRKFGHVIEKRLTKNSRLTFVDKFYSFAIVLVTSKRIEVQSYGYWLDIIDGKESLESTLVNFEIFDNDECVKITKWGKGYVFGLTPNYGGMSSPYHGTIFYKNNWETKVKKISPLKYLKFKYDDIQIYALRNWYHYRFEIEFLQKINAKKLVDEVMYPKYSYQNGTYRKGVDMRTLNKKWLKENKQFFKNSNRDFYEFELEKRIKNRNGKVVPGIEKFLDYHAINKIPKGIGMVKFQNWVIKNKINMLYYFDYLNMLKDLNIDPTGDANLIIPKDLKKAHDNAVELLNQLKIEQKRKENEKLQQEYEETLVKRLKLERVVGNYEFKIPRDIIEIIQEGKALHHCVGGSHYIERHSKGQTTIVFVRKKNDTETPFYTLEYQKGHIVQLRGKRNQRASHEVETASEKWIELIKKEVI